MLNTKVTCAISLKIFVARSLLSSRGIRARIGLVGLQGVRILQLLVAGLFAHFPPERKDTTGGILLLNFWTSASSCCCFLLLWLSCAERWRLRNGFCVGHHAHTALEHVWLPRGTYGA